MLIPSKTLVTLCLVLSLAACRSSKPASSNQSDVVPQTEAVAPAAPSPAITGKAMPGDHGYSDPGEFDTDQLFAMKPDRSYQLGPKSPLSAEVTDPGLSELVLPAKKDEYIRVSVVTESPAPPFAAGMVNGPKIKSLTPDYCKEGMYPIAQDGNLRLLVLNRTGSKYPLQFTRFEAADPLLNPGIKPEQIEVNLGNFGPAKKIDTVPYELVCEVGESWPANVQIQGKGIWLTVTRVAGYNELFPGAHDMQQLFSSLKPGVRTVDAKNLPYANSGDASTVMTAQPKLIQGDGWHAWRWIEGSSQDGDYPGGIMYVSEGLTDDNKFFFRLTGLIKHPDVKKFEPTAPSNSDDNFGRAERLRLEKALVVAPPSSFQPNLNDFDAVVRSLKFRR